MGMFDDVIYEANCINCNEILRSFQTKSAYNQLRVIRPEEIVNGSFYCYCPECHTYNCYNVESKTELIVHDLKITLREEED